MDPKRSHSKPKADSSSSSSGGSEDGSPASTSTANAFANDGSFMEMFKKKMEEEMKKKSEDASGSELGQTHQDRRTTPAVTSFVGKRRGGVFLKTGMVAKKQKPDTEMVPGKSDAWSKYMAEVKKYKAHQCSDDDKTRPLVK